MATMTMSPTVVPATPPPVNTDSILLEDGSGGILLEDGSGIILLE